MDLALHVKPTGQFPEQKVGPPPNARTSWGHSHRDSITKIAKFAKFGHNLEGLFIVLDRGKRRYFVHEMGGDFRF